MADPITITTAIITFATFLKDIIHIAQEIKQSVKKVPQNRKNIRKLSDEVVADLLELEKFCTPRAQLLESSTELHEALKKLRFCMSAVHVRCLDLFIPAGAGTLDKMRAAYKAWKKCDEVEAEIAELRERVKETYIRFTAFTVARLEAPVNLIMTTTTRIENTLLVLDENQRMGLNRMEHIVTSMQIEPAQGPSSRTETIKLSTGDVATMYLHQQIETITESLDRLTSTSTFAQEQPRGAYLQPFKSIIGITHASKEPASFHREVVASALEIIHALQNDSKELSIQEGAWNMVNLAIRLRRLEMYSDMLTIGIWTVDLFRTLVALSPTVYEPYLLLTLLNLSRYKTEAGDHAGAAQAAEECVERQRALLEGPSPSHHVRHELAAALIEYWQVVNKRGDAEQMLKVAQEALGILKAIRVELSEWEAWAADMACPVETDSTQERTSAEEEIQHITATGTSPPLTRDDDQTLRLDYNTARALHNLSNTLRGIERYDEARDADERALSIVRSISAKYPEVFDDILGACLVHLCYPPLSNDRPKSTMLEYSREAVSIYRRMCAKRPTKYTPLLVETLWDHATLLTETDLREEAQAISNEAINLIRQSHGDRRLLADAFQKSSWTLRRLKQNEAALSLRQEAVGIYRNLDKPTSSLGLDGTHADPMSMPHALCDLASDLLLVGQCDNGVAVCKEAVEQYRVVACTLKSHTATESLANGLSYLCHCYNVVERFDQALCKGNEALAMYRNLLSNLDKDKNIPRFLTALHRTSFAACHASSADSVSISTEIIRDHLLLIVDHKDAVGYALIDARRNHDYILGKHAQFRETVANTEELVALLEFATAEGDMKAAKDLVDGLISHAGNLEDAGRYQDAAAFSQKAIDACQAFPVDNITAELHTDALAARSTFLRYLGQYSEALDLIQRGVDFLRTYPLADGTAHACRLRELAICLHKVGRLDEALKIGKEALKLCRSSVSEALFAEARLPYILESVAAITDDVGDEAQALVIAQEAVDLYRRIKTSNTTLAPWVYAESIYADALATLASCHAATGNYAAAYVLLDEAKHILQKYTVQAPGYFPRLAKVLDSLAVILCALGRHEEGARITADLVDRQRHLAAIYPELALVVCRALDDAIG